METNIVLKQKPVIEHQLKKAGESVTERIAKLDLDKQVAIPETFRALKAIRAELNKEFKDFEEQRKDIKKAISNPYSEFEQLYNAEIKDKYIEANETLKEKIDFVEDGIKVQKRDNVIRYFNELCIAEQIEFLKWENLKIDIKLSTTEKAYKEEVDEFVMKVKDELELIDTQGHKAEILAEYKQTLNAAKAIQTINDRKEREKKERLQLKLQEETRRKTLLQNRGLKWDGMASAFVYDDDIYILWEEVKDVKREDFEKEVLMLEEQIKVKLAYLQQVEKHENPQPEVKEESNPTPAPVAEPIKQPIKEEKKVAARFQATASLVKLKALGAYMKANGIEYKNLKE